MNSIQIIIPRECEIAVYPNPWADFTRSPQYMQPVYKTTSCFCN